MAQSLKLRDINPQIAFPFVLFHGIGIWGFFYFPGTLNLISLAALSYVVRCFGVTAGYHRYFSHRSFQLNRFFQFCLAWLGCSAAHNGPLWWASKHREHHLYSDDVNDPHSPKHGFWHSHMFWLLKKNSDRMNASLVKDWLGFPELVFIDKFKEIPIFVLLSFLYFIGGWPFVIWGFFVPNLFVWHLAFANNSVAHTFGYQNFKSGDSSRNNLLLGYLNLGEGWHNNHHHNQKIANQGVKWWEFDFTFRILQALSFIGVVKNLHLPNQRKK